MWPRLLAPAFVATTLLLSLHLPKVSSLEMRSWTIKNPIETHTDPMPESATVPVTESVTREPTVDKRIEDKPDEVGHTSTLLQENVSTQQRCHVDLDEHFLEWQVFQYSFRTRISRGSLVWEQAVCKSK